MRYADGLYHFDFGTFTVRFTHFHLFPLKVYLKYYTPGHGDTIVDAGAFNGMFSVILSKMVRKTGRVIAFEPDAENFSRLLRHLELNRCGNVIPVNKGLWSEETRLTFYGGCESSSSLFCYQRIAAQAQKTVVPVVRLDRELERLGVRTVDFIKMDIEGAEIAALAGCEAVLRHSSPQLSIASYHEVDGEKTCYTVEKKLSALGYRVETLLQDELITYGEKR